MTRTVHCRKFDQELPGLMAPPYPGAKGIEIYEGVSAKAWQEWQANQLMLINEHRLNLMDAATRKWLEGEMDKFFSGQDYAKPEGFVAPSND